MSRTHAATSDGRTADAADTADAGTPSRTVAVLLMVGLLAAAVALGAFVLPAGAQAEDEQYVWTTGPVRVLDGDTLRVGRRNASDQQQVVAVRLVDIEGSLWGGNPAHTLESGEFRLSGFGFQDQRDLAIEVVSPSDAVVPSAQVLSGAGSMSIPFHLVGPGGVGTHGAVLNHGAELSASIAALNASLDALDAGLADRLDVLAGELATGLDDTQQALASRVDALESALGDRVDALDQRLDARLDSLDAGLADVLAALADIQASLEQQPAADPSPAASVPTPPDSRTGGALAETGAAWLMLGLVVGMAMIGLGGAVVRLSPALARAVSTAISTARRPFREGTEGSSP